MDFSELSNEQRRQLVDIKQVFEAWRDADREFRHSYRGTMRWHKSGHKEYLRRVYGKVWESLGPRSPETEAIKESYTEQRTRLRQRVTRLANRLNDMAKVNRALGLGRIPAIAARVLRKLDEAGLLGRSLFVVGTHSLFAYEARAGLVLSGTLTATGDIDLLWDARRRLSLAVADDVRAEGIIGMLRKVDRSFESSPGHYRAVNDDGYYVDLIRPLGKNEPLLAGASLTGHEHDMSASAIIGLQWLINAPKFDEVIVGDDGRPLYISCVDPRAFALHKTWLAKQDGREPTKRRRDAAQARAVAAIASDYLNLKFNAKDLSALPLEMTKCAKDLVASTSKGKRSSL